MLVTRTTEGEQVWNSQKLQAQPIHMRDRLNSDEQQSPETSLKDQGHRLELTIMHTGGCVRPQDALVRLAFLLYVATSLSASQHIERGM